jgi:uncharacterized membrane protein
MTFPWLWIAAGTIAGGIIHIVAVLATPYLAREDAWGRLARISDINQMQVLPPRDEAAQRLPLMSMDIGYAFCRYDLSEGNVVIKAKIPDDEWTTAIYTRHGANYYVISGADIQRSEIRMLLVPLARLAEEASTETSAEGEEQIIVIAPEMQGTVLIRTPNRGPAFAERTTEVLASALCTPAEVLAAEEPEPELTPGMPPLPVRSFRPARGADVSSIN